MVRSGDGDLDWAPDYILEDLHDLLGSAAVPVTLFCMNRSPAVERLLALSWCEAAFPPNS